MHAAKFGAVSLGRHQRGMVSTLIALIVLVATLLAAVALMRSVDTSNTVAGVLTFRQEVLQEAERAYVDAQQKITFTQPTNYADQPALGYYAEVQPATARSAGDIPNVLINETSGSIGTVSKLTNLTNQGNALGDNQVSYVVERLCATAGAPASNGSGCVTAGAAITGGSSSNQNSDNTTFTNTGNAAFRLTVRVDGSKGTVAYVQTIMR